MRHLSRITLSAVLLAVFAAPATLLAQAPPAATPATPATPAKPAAAPRLAAVEAVKDVGKVAKSEKVDVVFEIRNNGDAELVLSDVRPTCGCTVAKYDARIAPGATGKVHAAVDTSDFSGPIAKTITVLSNDPATPRLTLTIKADVQPQVELYPGFARFNFVQSQEATSARQWVWASNHPGFEILSVQSPYKFVTASFRKAKPDELHDGESAKANPNQWLVETTIQPDAEIGALREFLVVKTNHPKQKELRIPVTGFVRPVMSVTPYVADLGAVQLSEPGKDFSLILTNFGKEPVQITRVSTPVAGVEATVKTLEAGKRFEIKLVLSPGMAKGAIDSTLKIETTSTAKPTLDVPLKGTIS